VNNLLAQVQFGDAFQVKPGVGMSNWIYTEPGKLVSVLLNNAYMVAGLIILFLFLFGGISFIINSGQGNPKKSAQNAKMLSSTLIGFLIIFASYWIIQIIEAITGLKILDPLPIP